MNCLWDTLPTEIRCMVITFLAPQELCPIALVHSTWNALANSDAVWQTYCNLHFPNLCENIDTTYKDTVMAGEEKRYIVTQGVSYPASSSWKEKYKNLSRNLCVLHHKYNTINEPALQDALLKWTERGIHPIDVRATCNAWTDEKLDETISDLQKVLKRHRVAFLFTDGGMKDNFRNPLGDTLCDFVEDGNAVIVGTFCTVAKAEMPGGRWQSKNYNPILEANQDSSIHFLGEKILPFHPILHNVENISAAWKATGEAHPDARVLAFYDVGYVLVAEIEVNNPSNNKKGLVIAVNIYLPSSDSPLAGWSNEPGNDVQTLFANCFKYAMKYVCEQNSTGPKTLNLEYF